MIGQWKLLLANIVVQLLIILAFEWEAAAKKSIEKNTECPDISWWACVFNLTYYFGRHVRRSSTEDLDFFLVRNAC